MQRASHSLSWFLLLPPASSAIRSSRQFAGLPPNGVRRVPLSIHQRRGRDMSYLFGWIKNDGQVGSKACMVLRAQHRLSL